MKHLLHSLALRVTMLIALLVSFGSSGAWAVEVPITTADFTTKAASNSSYSGTWTYGDWSLTNCANNNGNWAYIRCGGKGGSKSTDTKSGSTTIVGTSSISSAISEVKILHNGRSNNNFTLDGATLEVSSSSSFSTIDNTINLTPSVSTSTAGNFSFEGTFATGSYYRVTINWTVKGSSNYGLDITKIEFYAPAAAPSQVATPTFSPTAGAVPYNSEITISCETAGATIYYTTDGSTPTSSSTEYDPDDKPVVISSVTINAIAIDGSGDLTDSEVGTAAYSVKNPDAPTFSLDGGLVLKGTTLELTSAAGTSIRYTTDGTTPTASVGTVYSSPITINDPQTIKAVAYDGGNNTSTTASKDYTVFVGEIVTFDATSDTGTSLSKNGVSFTTSATESSVFKFYKSSTSTFSATNGKIKQIVFTGVSGYAISNMTASTGTLNTSDSPNGVWSGNVTSVTFTASTAQTRATKIKVYVAKTDAPTFSVDEGAYSEAKSVELSCATDGASIYYTTDGSTPTSSSTAYSSAISVTETQTIKAIAIYDGIESAVSSATYTMNRPLAPAFDVAAGVFDEAFDLHVSTETDGAIIYYTTDGSTPTTSSSVYSTKVAISTATTTVKAIAVKNGLTSDVSSATYTYDSRETPTFSLSSTAVDLKVNDSGEVTLTTNHDGTITAVGNDDDHFTVDYNTTTKKYEFLADHVGEYTITFSATGSATYKNAESSVTVTVTKKPSTVLTTPSFTNKDMYSTPKSGSFTGVAQYNSSNIAGAEVTYSSSDETVATINESTGAVTFVGAGSTTLTASYAGDDEYEAAEASYVLTLYDTTPQEMEVEVALNSTTLGTTSPDGKTATTNNVSITTNTGSASTPLTAYDKHVRMYKGSNLVVNAPAGYTIINIVFTEPASDKTWNDDPTASNGTYSSKSWTGEANSVTFTFDAGQCRIASMTVTLAEVFTVGSAGYTTYVTKHAVSFPSGVKAYIVTDKDSETLTLTETASAPKSTPLILKANADTYKLTVIDDEDAADVTGNMLHAAELDGSTKGDGSTIFALGVGKADPYVGVVGFYLVKNGETVPAGKAYLEVTAPGVKGFTFNFDGVATGVNAIAKGQEATANGQIFNLAGQRVSKAQKGLYIVNGKKVLVK